jgi:hypothetical protein
VVERPGKSEADPEAGIIKVRLRSGYEFLDRYGSRDGQDEVFLAEALGHEIGDEVQIDLYFDHSGYAFRVGGKVVSRRLTRAGQLEPGARVALTGDDSTIRAMILSHARGEDIDYRARSNERARCHFPIKVTAPIQARGVVLDLSPGGARVADIDPPDLGVKLELKLHPPGTLFSLPVAARVVWRRPGSEPLMGLAFDHGKVRGERKLRDLVTRLALLEPPTSPGRKRTP